MASTDGNVRNETQVEELNSYNRGNGSKHSNSKEDLGSQSLCCSRSKLSVKQETLSSRSGRQTNAHPSLLLLGIISIGEAFTHFLFYSARHS